MRAANVEIGVMAYVTQFAPQDFVQHPEVRHDPVPP